MRIIDYIHVNAVRAEIFRQRTWASFAGADLGRDECAVAQGARLELPSLISVIPDRNHDTVFMIIDRVAREADTSWLPLPKAWSVAETLRARERLAPIIARLEQKECREST